MKKQVLSILGCAACAVALAMPAMAAAKPAATAKTPAAIKILGPSETLSGKIDLVKPAQNLVVMEDSSGVPFDLVVTHGTRILSGDHAVSLTELQQDQNQTVSVRFVPERRGDVARSIRIGG